MKNKKPFVLGFLSAFGVLVIVLACAYVYLALHSEELLDRVFTVDGDVEVELKIPISAEPNLSGAISWTTEELARFLAQGDEENEKSYLAILNSGLNVAVALEYDGDESKQTHTIYVSGGTRQKVVREIRNSSVLHYEHDETDLHKLLRLDHGDKVDPIKPDRSSNAE